MYTNIESLCCTPETNIILYVNYTSIKKTSRNSSQIQGWPLISTGWRAPDSEESTNCLRWTPILEANIMTSQRPPSLKKSSPKFWGSVAQHFKKKKKKYKILNQNPLTTWSFNALVLDNPRKSSTFNTSGPAEPEKILKTSLACSNIFFSFYISFSTLSVILGDHAHN